MTEEVECKPIKQDGEVEPIKKKKKKKKKPVDGEEEAPEKKKKKKKKKLVDGEEKPKSAKKKKKKMVAEDGIQEESGDAHHQHDEAPESPKKETSLDETVARQVLKPHSPKRKKKKTSPTSSQHDEAPESPKKETSLDDSAAQQVPKHHSPKRKKKKKKKTSPTSSPISPKKRKSVKKHKKTGAKVEESSGANSVDVAAKALSLHKVEAKANGANLVAKKSKNESIPGNVLEKKSPNKVFEEIPPSNFILESERVLASKPVRKRRKPTTSEFLERTSAVDISPTTYEAVLPPRTTRNSYNFSHGLRGGMGCGLPTGLPAGM